MRKSLAIALLPLVAACATTNAVPDAPPPRSGTIAVPPTQPPRSAPTGQFRPPQVMNLPGLEGVIGSNVLQLQQQFGVARLDVYEGDVRKLQWVGDACVLDVFLYPLSPGAEPTATYVDARRSSDALDVDRASCVAALKR